MRGVCFSADLAGCDHKQGAVMFAIFLAAITLGRMSYKKTTHQESLPICKK